MKKIFIKMILLIGVLLAVPYYMMGGAMPDFMTSLLPSGSSQNLKGVSGIGSAVTDEAVTVYEWVDEKGRKHFSNTPPAGQNAKALQLRPDTNLIQAVKPQVEKVAPRPKVTSIGEMKSPYTPGGAKKLIDDAKNVQEMLNQRFDQQKALIDQR